MASRRHLWPIYCTIIIVSICILVGAQQPNPGPDPVPSPSPSPKPSASHDNIWERIARAFRNNDFSDWVVIVFIIICVLIILLVLIIICLIYCVATEETAPSFNDEVDVDVTPSLFQRIKAGFGRGSRALFSRRAPVSQVAAEDGTSASAPPPSEPATPPPAPTDDTPSAISTFNAKNTAEEKFRKIQEEMKDGGNDDGRSTMMQRRPSTGTSLSAVTAAVPLDTRPPDRGGGGSAVRSSHGYSRPPLPSYKPSSTPYPSQVSRGPPPRGYADDNATSMSAAMSPRSPSPTYRTPPPRSPRQDDGATTMSNAMAPRAPTQIQTPLTGENRYRVNTRPPPGMSSRSGESSRHGGRSGGTKATKRPSRPRGGGGGSGMSGNF